MAELKIQFESTEDLKLFVEWLNGVGEQSYFEYSLYHSNKNYIIEYKDIDIIAITTGDETGN